MTQKVPDTFPPCGGSSASHNPLMHVQDQKPTGTQGGSSVDGDNIRVLNTVLTNEITGASLASNEITLPAGKYYVEASSQCKRDATITAQGHIAVNGVVVLTGLSEYDEVGKDNQTLSVTGKITLSNTSSLTVISEVNVYQATNGLGSSSNLAQHEVYTDLCIWQLDSVIKAPVIRDNRLYPIPGTAYLTGDIIGLGYSYATANTINVEAGICYDSFNTTLLNAAAGQSVSIPTTINTVQNLFVCDDGIVRTDTDVDGATLLAGTVNQLRWIGFVTTNSGGSIVDCELVGNLLSFKEEFVVFTATGSDTGLADWSAFVPASRVSVSYLSNIYKTVAGGVKISIQNDNLDFFTINDSPINAYQSFLFVVGGTSLFGFPDHNGNLVNCTLLR